MDLSNRHAHGDILSEESKRERSRHGFWLPDSFAQAKPVPVPRSRSAP